MKFTVEKTSDYAYYDAKNQPCVGAKSNGTDWYITIKSLPDLIKFINKNGRVIISSYGDDTETPNIEIYDDYRE